VGRRKCTRKGNTWVEIKAVNKATKEINTNATNNTTKHNDNNNYKKEHANQTIYKAIFSPPDD